MRIRYYCHYSSLTGYGRAARDYLAALHATGQVELEIAVFGQSLASPEPRYQHLDAFARSWMADELAPCDVAIFHAQPRLLASIAASHKKREGRHYVALTTWETSRMPRDYLAALSHYDAVIVPSEFCADVLEGTLNDGGPIEHNRRSVPDVHIVPHCFDPSFWVVPSEPRRDDGIVRFYSIGAWGERKNMAGVLRAYLSEFDKSDAVHLHMQIEGVDFNELRTQIALGGLAVDEYNPLLPPLTVPDDGALSEAQLVALHANHDCFVSATRGEGWGLGLFEAAIMGRHVISPLWGGQSDFLDEYGLCEGVPHMFTPCFASVGKTVVERDGRRWEMAKFDFTPGMTCKQAWAEPDLRALAARMRYVYEMKKGTVAVPFITPTQAADERRELERKFSYAAVGPMFVNTLREIIE